MSKYQNLDAWKEAMELVKEIYLIVKQFPKEELYGLSSQIKRAAVSIPANIAEGIGRQYRKDTIQFLHIARGSIYELETLIKIAVLVGILMEEVSTSLDARISKTMRLLNGLIKYLESSSLK